MKIINLDQIKKMLPSVNLIAEIEKGYVEYSTGQAVIPPVGELIFDEPPGEAHIKYGYIKDSPYYLIKIASGFGNKSDGLMLVFDKKNGQPICLLQDEGYLTNVRTAIAGAIAAKYLAPKNISNIGIVGTGTQAKLQLEYLNSVVDCNNVIVFGRSEQSLENYQNYFSNSDYKINTTTDIAELANNCQVIVCTTPSKNALIKAEMIHAGTHITAIGSDTKEKQELSSELLGKADLVVTDSKSQAQERGEIYHAIRNGDLEIDDVREIGVIINAGNPVRNDDSEITIADFTGIATQDIKITEAVM